MDTQIIALPRQGGKTTELITLASRTGFPIITLHKKACYDMIKARGFEMFMVPLDARQFMRVAPGAKDIYKFVYIDDADTLAEMGYGVEINDGQYSFPFLEKRGIGVLAITVSTDEVLS